MTNIHLVQGQYASGALPIFPSSLPEDGRVRAATAGFFSQVHEKAVRVWSAVVLGVNVAAESVSIVFFRVLEWVHPMLGPRVEAIWLRVTNIFQRIKAAWKDQRVKEEIDDLRERVKILNGAVEEKNRLALENGRLTQEKNQLYQEKELLIEERNFIQNNRGSLEEERGGWHQERAEILKQNEFLISAKEELKRNNEDLAAQKDRALQRESSLIKERDEIQKRSDLLQLELKALENELNIARVNGPLNDLLARIAQVFPQALSIGQGRERMGLDDDVEGVVPILQRQLSLAIDGLKEAKGSLQGTAAEIKVQSLIRILTVLGKHLRDVPVIFQFHRDLRNPLELLLNPTNV